MKTHIFSTGIKFSAKLITYLSIFAFVVILGIDLFNFITKGYVNDPLILIMITLQLIVIYVSNIMKKRQFLNLNDSIFYFSIVFGFCSQILGELFGFYNRFTWWDTALHLSSGVVLCFLGIALIILLLPNEVEKNVNLVLIVLFGMFFAITVGVVWEIFEYGVDQMFGANMQKSFYIAQDIDVNSLYNAYGRFNDPGLIDTMNDLMIDLTGCVIAGCYTFINQKKDIKLSFK